MFGFVNVSGNELTKEQKKRYGAVYCGICRKIRQNASQLSRLGLSYDMAFLALLLSSLYEPEETGGDNACMLHPIRRSPWVESPYVEYAADMNVALAYYNALDDWDDDKKLSAKAVPPSLKSTFPGSKIAIPGSAVRWRTAFVNYALWNRKTVPIPICLPTCSAA